MDDKCFKLEVENYQSSLLLELHNLQKEGCLCDLCLVAKDGSVKVHGAVLMAASPYFKQRLSSTSSKELDSMNFPHIKLSVLQCAVHFIYTGVLNVTMNTFRNVAQLCTELKLEKAVELCESALEVKYELEEEEALIEKQKTDKLEPDLSDHYADSTDVESVVETPPKLKKQKLNRKSRKRSHNALKYENENKNSKIDKASNADTIDSQKQDPIPLKVPKLSISVKRRTKNEEDFVGKKRKQLKQLKLEVKRKGKKSQKVTADKRVKQKVQSDMMEKKENDSGTLVKVEGDIDIEDTNNTNAISGDGQNSDTLNDVICKSDDKDASLTDVEEMSFPKQCHVCKETFENMKTFSKHIRTHNVKTRGRRKSKQEVWPCSVCGRELTTAVRQACHHYSKHGIPYDEKLKLHACDVEGCKYITASRHYLQIHKKGRHGNERPHVCEFCGKGFKLPSALVTHLNIHTNSKIFKCDDCDLTFNQKGGLDIHVKKHHKGQASWTELCHLCSEKFLQKAELSWHMYVAHQIPLPDRYKVYSCELCDYQTIRKNKLERHQDAHNDNRSWTCNICGKKFVTKSYLNRHLRYHGEKSFKCTFDGCTYACVDNIGLKKHIRLMHTHKNYKPFMCSLCQYKTGLRGNLDKHIRTVHNLDVVTKHTVHLKMKFKNRQSGDILTKDGQLIDTVVDHRGEDPERLQAMLDSGEEEQEELDNKAELENKPVDMILKDGVVFTALTARRKPAEDEVTSQVSTSEDSGQLVTVTTSSTSQSTTFPYVYNGLQYLTPVSQIPYTMVPLPTQIAQGEMYATIDPMALPGTKLTDFF